MYQQAIVSPKVKGGKTTAVAAPPSPPASPVNSVESQAVSEDTVLTQSEAGGKVRTMSGSKGLKRERVLSWYTAKFLSKKRQMV